MPHLFVSDLHLGALLNKEVFLLREKSLIVTSQGKPMLRVLLADRTGSIGGVLWDASPSLAAQITEGQGVQASGRVTEFRGQLQVTLDRIASAQISDPHDFLPSTRRPLSELERELRQVLESVAQPDLRRLLGALLEDTDTYARYTQAPAAKSFHHACVGGLLEHTLDIVRLADAASAQYPEVNRDLLVAAALLHDLGKIDAYDPITFDFTELGRLWGHLYMSAAMVERAIAALPGFDADLKQRLLHAILAHHGKLENGSPVLPMTLEAILLTNIDRLDADVRGALDHLERTQEDAGAFTDRSMMHDTPLLR
jgi:3'-5' exoribonuclease